MYETEQKNEEKKIQKYWLRAKKRRMFYWSKCTFYMKTKTTRRSLIQIFILTHACIIILVLHLAKRFLLELCCYEKVNYIKRRLFLQFVPWEYFFFTLARIRIVCHHRSIFKLSIDRFVPQKNCYEINRISLCNLISTIFSFSVPSFTAKAINIICKYFIRCALFYGL